MCGVVGVCEVDVYGLCAWAPSAEVVVRRYTAVTYDRSFYALEFDVLMYFSTVADQQRT